MRAIAGLAAPGLAAALLAACGGDTLPGQGYLPPSEITVARTVPLTVPPDYGLRPGDIEEQPAAGGTVVAQRDADAVEAAPPGATPGERVLLARSGALEAEPGIRDTLNRENAILVGEPRLAEALLFGDHPSGGAAGGSGVAIEQSDDEPGWFAEAWDSLGY